MPLPESGEQLKEILVGLGFANDPSQRPELGGGFQCLRRRELIRLATMADVVIPNPDGKKDLIVAMIKAANAEGKFDKLVHRKPDPKDVEIAELRRRMADLEHNVSSRKVKVHESVQKLSRRGPGSKRKELIRRAIDLGFGGEMAATSSNDALELFIKTKELGAPAAEVGTVA